MVWSIHGPLAHGGHANQCANAITQVLLLVTDRLCGNSASLSQSNISEISRGFSFIGEADTVYLPFELFCHFQQARRQTFVVIYSYE